MKNSNVECLVTRDELENLLAARETAMIQMQRAKDARDLEKNPVYFLTRERFLFQWQGRLEALEFTLRTLGYSWPNVTDWQGDNDNSDNELEWEDNLYDE